MAPKKLEKGFSLSRYVVAQIDMFLSINSRWIKSDASENLQK